MLELTEPGDWALFALLFPDVDEHLSALLGAPATLAPTALCVVDQPSALRGASGAGEPAARVLALVGAAAGFGAPLCWCLDAGARPLIEAVRVSTAAPLAAFPALPERLRGFFEALLAPGAALLARLTGRSFEWRLAAPAARAVEWLPPGPACGFRLEWRGVPLPTCPAVPGRTGSALPVAPSAGAAAARSVSAPATRRGGDSARPAAPVGAGSTISSGTVATLELWLGGGLLCALLAALTGAALAGDPTAPPALSEGRGAPGVEEFGTGAAELAVLLRTLAARWESVHRRERLHLSTLLAGLSEPEVQRVAAAVLAAGVEPATLALAAASYGAETADRVRRALARRVRAEAERALVGATERSIQAVAADTRARVTEALIAAVAAGRLRWEQAALLDLLRRRLYRCARDLTLARGSPAARLAGCEDWAWRELLATLGADRFIDACAGAAPAAAGRARALLSARRAADFDAECARPADTEARRDARFAALQVLAAIDAALLAAPPPDEWSALLLEASAKGVHACLCAHSEEQLAAALADAAPAAQAAVLGVVSPQLGAALRERPAQGGLTEQQCRHARARIARTLRAHDPDGRLRARYFEHRAHAAAGRWDEARAALADVAAVLPSFADVRERAQALDTLADRRAAALALPGRADQVEPWLRLLWRGRYFEALEEALAALGGGPGGGPGASDGGPAAASHRPTAPGGGSVAAPVRHYQGLCLLARGEWAAAHRAFRAALDLDPAHDEAAEGVIEVFSRERRAASAWALGRQRLESGRRLGSLGRLALVRAARLLGRRDEARALADALIAGTPAARRRCAAAWALLGEAPRARAALAALLERHPDYEAGLWRDADFAAIDLRGTMAHAADDAAAGRTLRPPHSVLSTPRFPGAPRSPP